MYFRSLLDEALGLLAYEGLDTGLLDFQGRASAQTPLPELSSLNFIKLGSDGPLYTGPNDDHGDTQATATAFSVGSTVTGIISQFDDIDYLSFNAVAGENIVFTLAGSSGLYVNIEDSFGSIWASLSVGEAYTFSPFSTETYYIYVTGGQTPSNFSISAAAPPPDIPGDTSTTEVLQLGGTVSSVSDGFGDQDWFIFNLSLIHI